MGRFHFPFLYIDIYVLEKFEIEIVVLYLNSTSSTQYSVIRHFLFSVSALSGTLEKRKNAIRGFEERCSSERGGAAEYGCASTCRYFATCMRGLRTEGLGLEISGYA
jgi:hypothetical protein